jgi:hypothetical protein
MRKVSISTTYRKGLLDSCGPRKTHVDFPGFGAPAAYTIHIPSIIRSIIRMFNAARGSVLIGRAKVNRLPYFHDLEDVHNNTQWIRRAAAPTANARTKLNPRIIKIILDCEGGVYWLFISYSITL